MKLWKIAAIMVLNSIASYMMLVLFAKKTWKVTSLSNIKIRVIYQMLFDIAS